MSVTHIITRKWSSPQHSTPVEVAVSLTDAAEVNMEVELGVDATDVEIPLAFDSSRVKSVFLYCESAVIIETNSSSSPGNTITLVAGKPTVWQDGETPIFTVDVVSFFCSKAGAAKTLQIRILHDPTA